MAIELIAKIAPKNDGFTGMVDADQVIGGAEGGTLPDNTVAASNVTQHEGSIGITASQVSDFDTEVSNNSDVADNTTHRTSNGTDHSYIGQDVTTTGTPTFANASSSNNATAAAHLVRLDQMNSAISGLNWQDAVEDQINFVTSEPGSPTTGDRYINTTTGTSSGTSQSVTANYIYEWNGADWTESVPLEGWTVWVKDIDTNYTFNGTAWVEFGSTISHNNTTGLQGGTTSQYYHLTNSQHTDLTDAGDSTLHYHAADRARANHTGTQLAATISDFVTQVTATKLDDFATPDDNTDLDATTSVHGLLPKLGGGTTNFLRADGTWAATPASGETNTMSNVGTAGVGVYKSKTGVNFDMKNINAGSNKITITDDTDEDEIDIDVVEANLSLANIGGDMDDIDNGTTYVKTHNDYTDAEQTKIGYISVAQAVDLDTMESDIATNNAKVTNADHTGEVTGSAALTIANDAVTYAKMQNVAANNVLLGRISGAAGNVEEVTVTQAQTLLSVETKKVEIITLDATDMSNKYFDLTETPSSTSNVEITPVGGIPQENTVDFNVISDGSTAKRIDWDTYGLDGLLELGDKVMVSYAY